MSDLREHINQKRFDSLVAKHLHKRRRQWLNRGNLLVDIFAIATPIVALSVRFVLKGGSHAHLADTIWEIMASILLALTVIKILSRWQENAQLHSKLMGENISIVGLADALLINASTLSGDLPAFRQLIDKSEADDSELLGEPNDSDRQWAYREALKETDKIHALCPVCSFSAWKYKQKWSPWDSARCQACGNKK